MNRHGFTRALVVTALAIAAAAAIGSSARSRTLAACGLPALDWADGAETDLIGYLVHRKDAPDAPVPAGVTPIYVVRAVDASGNVGAPTPEQAPSASARTLDR